MQTLGVLSHNPFFGHAIKEICDEQQFLVHLSANKNADLLIIDALHPPFDQLPPKKPVLWIGNPPEGVDQPFISTPFAVESLVRMVKETIESPPNFLPEGEKIGACLFLAHERRIRLPDKEMALTEKETQLLISLLKAGTIGKKREELLREIWAYSEDADTHTLETHIYRLRGKLKECGLEEAIRTIDDGYVLTA